MALFYPLTQGVPPELMSIFKLKSASGAHFQHTWTHFMQNSRKNLTFYSINIIYYLFTKFCTMALFAPTTSHHSRAKWDQRILSTKYIEVGKDRSWKKRRISFENHYFWKSNNLRNCSELVVSLVFELLKILIFIEDTGLFQMYNFDLFQLLCISIANLFGSFAGLSIILA